MFKRVLIILIAGIFIFGMNKLSFAMMCGGHARTHEQTAQAGHTEHQEVAQEAVAQETPKEAVNAGNKICPVSGEKIDEKMKATYEYEGKVYNFCCPSCVEEFKKDPEKYIQKVEQELQAESKEQAEHKEHEVEMMQGSETMHQEMPQGHHH